MTATEALLAGEVLVVYLAYSMMVDFQQVPKLTLLQKFIRWLGHPMGGTMV
jgi:hypothetical protein